MSFSYLALGDSYTIGEGVIFAQSFPSQFCDLYLSFGQNRQTVIGG